jgi:hypothetical protein
MRKQILVTTILVVIGLLLSGCMVSASSQVVDAWAVDKIFSVEILRSGALRLWLEDDNIAGYCTSDPVLIERAKELVGYEVEIHYVTTLIGDNEAWNATGCAKLYTGAESSTPIFKITGVERWIGQ